MFLALGGEVESFNM